MSLRSQAFALSALLALGACGNDATEGPAGPAGSTGPQGPAGTQGPTGPADVAQLELPGGAFYPESLSAAADGTLYVGSLGTGQVVKFAPGSASATVFVPASAGLKAIAGVHVDDQAGLLWVCANDFMDPTATSLRSFTLSNGTAKDNLKLAGFNSCNDVTFDGQHNLYATDPKDGLILKLANNGTALTMWSTAAVLQPTDKVNGFGVDGIAFDGQTNLYANHFEQGKLFRVPIKGDGTADVPVEITVTPKLYSPDGMISINANSYLTVENNALATAGELGQLVRIDVTGTTATKTVLNNRLDTPTAVTKAGNFYWVSEGQLQHLITMSFKPKLPFQIRRTSM